MYVRQTLKNRRARRVRLDERTASELRRWKRLVRLAGVPVIPLHGARHSYAELALSSGVRLDVVSRTLGHASSSFTADQYSHDSDDAAAKVRS